MGHAPGTNPFMQLNSPAPRSRLPSPLRCPAQAEATVRPQQPLEATSPSSSLVAINRQSAGPAVLALSREQVPFQRGKKMNMCFVMHASGSNEPKNCLPRNGIISQTGPFMPPDQPGRERGLGPPQMTPLGKPWPCHAPAGRSRRSLAKGRRGGSRDWGDPLPRGG